MSGTEELKDQEMVDGNAPEESQKTIPSSEEEVWIYDLDFVHLI